MDSVVVLSILAQVVLLSASGLLGAGLSLQASVTAARTTQDRLEQQAEVAGSALASAQEQLESLERAASQARDDAQAEIDGTGVDGASGIPGIGPRANFLLAEADDAARAAEQQRDLNARLAASSEVESERARLAADDQERVALLGSGLAGILLVAFCALTAVAETSRSRRAVADAAADAVWRQHLMDSLARLEGRVNRADDTAPPHPGGALRRLWRWAAG